MISPGLFSFFWNFHFLDCYGGKRAKNSPGWPCLVHFISLKSYIIWFSFMVLMFKMIISSGVFFIFSKFWFSGLLGGKRAKNSLKWQKICLSCSISQEPFLIWLSFVVQKCKVIISLGVFFFNYYFKILIFGLLGGSKGKNGPKWQIVLCTVYLRNHASYDSWFMVHLCKRIISQGVFYIFSKFSGSIVG